MAAACRIVGYNLAEDAVAHAVLNAWRAHQSWDGSASIATWLVAITRNAALDDLRKAGARPQRTGDSEAEEAHIQRIEDPRLNPEQQVFRSEVRAIVADAVGDLAPGMRKGFKRWLSGDELGDAKVQAFRARLVIVPAVRERLGLS